MKIEETNKIQKLAPILVEHFMDWEVAKSEWDLYREKIEKYKQYIGLAQKYFFYNSHDSDILSLKKINKNDLQFILNDISTLEFAYALINKKGLDIGECKLEFPIEITSKGTKHLSLNTVDENSGDIHPCKLRKLNEYLYEEIITREENKIEIAFDLWSNKKNPANRYLLLLSCMQLHIEEKQSVAWQKYFGDVYDDYYKYFTMKRDQGVFLSDYSLCEKLIDEYETLKPSVYFKS